MTGGETVRPAGEPRNSRSTVAGLGGPDRSTRCTPAMCRMRHVSNVAGARSRASRRIRRRGSGMGRAAPARQAATQAIHELVFRVFSQMLKCGPSSRRVLPAQRSSDGWQICPGPRRRKRGLLAATPWCQALQSHTLQTASCGSSVRYCVVCGPQAAGTAPAAAQARAAGSWLPQPAG